MNGIIVKAIGGIYYVEASDGIYECKARGVFRRKNISPVGGDRVEFSLEDDGSGVIEKIEERRSLLIRPPLANLDMLVFVSSTCEPRPNLLLLDKFIAIAVFKKIEPVVVFTKIDKESCDELVDIYINSVGGNATFLLNIPPAPSGLFHENDVARLGELGSFIEKAFSDNLVPRAKMSADSCESGHEISGALIDSYDSYYKTRDGVTQCEVSIEFDRPERLSYLVLKENILLSQRIESFEVYADGVPIYSGTVVGYKRIVRLGGAEAKLLTVKITDSRVSPTLSFIGVY